MTASSNCHPKIFTLEGRGLKLDSLADVEEHIKPLRFMQDVEEIRLLGNTLGVEACQAIGEVIATKKSLQVANLADIFTGRLLNEIPLALSSLLRALGNLPNLHTINLNDNAFGLNTQAPLVEFISSHVPLKHLILNNNGLGPEAGIMIAEALSTLHAKKEEARKAGLDIPHLETVICGRNRLETGSMKAWAKAYSLHTGLKNIKMVQNGIRPDGISLLLRDGLKHSKQIEILDLQDNTFTIKGANALAIVSPGWTEIQELGIGDSLLGGRGGVVVAEALGKGMNKKLQTLRLQYNDIGAKGLQALALATKDSLPALRKLELNGNKFSEDDESIEVLRSLLLTRKEETNELTVIDEEWGLDSLSDLEDDDSSDEEEDEVEAEDEMRKRVSLAANKALEGPSVTSGATDIDELAQSLANVKI
ncbi:BgTH12-01102 [Blumeria graminis f. sp. triticale]|nr:BgTH12-01102 [Blumeria graminis f. sp. triticale]